MKKNSWVTVIAAIGGLLWCWGLIGLANGQENLPKLVRRIQPAVVTVLAYDAHGKIKGQGSGFFVDSNRFITNYHVLAGASHVEVKTSDKKRYSVERIVAEDKASDLVVATTENPYVDIEYGNLKISAVMPEVGERIIVVGSPLGLEQTLSEGVVSAVRDIPDLGEIMQITAPISPGSSGSPVVNLRGEVVGVATLQLAKGQNLNFAMPGSRALALLQKAVKLPATSTRPSVVGKKTLPPPGKPTGESITVTGKLTKKGFDREDGTAFYIYYISGMQGQFLLSVNFDSDERKRIVKAEKLGWDITVFGRIDTVVAGPNIGKVLKTPEGYKIIKVKYVKTQSKGIKTIVKDIKWSETGDSLIIYTTHGDFLLYMWGENKDKTKRIADILSESKKDKTQIIIHSDQNLIEDVQTQKIP